MISRNFLAAATLLLIAWPNLALADGYLKVQCALSDDKSRMIVTASNPENKAYACLVACRINIKGQRAIDPFKCTFPLRANAGEKIVCERKGSGPGYFSKVSPAAATCSPR